MTDILALASQVIVKNDCTAKQFLAQVEEESTHKVKSYTVSFNGRLLRHENVLYDIGIRDGQKVAASLAATQLHPGIWAVVPLCLWSSSQPTLLAVCALT